jgi:uncharacterized DUF497 family protein
MRFEWDPAKERTNHAKHGVSFAEAQFAFLDARRVIAIDRKHSTRRERRYFCFGAIAGRVLTVRFTCREDRIRIFGAGYWREGRKRYEEANGLHEGA